MMRWDDDRDPPDTEWEQRDRELERDDRLREYAPKASPQCALAGEGHCLGRLEWHHAVTKDRLKRAFPHGAIIDYHERPRRYIPASRMWSPDPDVTLDAILGDTRNRVWLCGAHHEKVTNARLAVDLPESVWEFAREYGLDAPLENDIARRVA